MRHSRCCSSSNPKTSSSVACRRGAGATRSNAANDCGVDVLWDWQVASVLTELFHGLPLAKLRTDNRQRMPTRRGAIADQWPNCSELGATSPCRWRSTDANLQETLSATSDTRRGLASYGSDDSICSPHGSWARPLSSLATVCCARPCAVRARPPPGSFLDAEHHGCDGEHPISPHIYGGQRDHGRRAHSESCRNDVRRPRG